MCSKVLERIISVRLYSVLQDSCSQVQFGFRSGHSTLQQLLLFYHQIFCKSSSCHDQWDIVYLDFCKAFDTVSHSKLMSKLYNLGVDGDLWFWLRCYLEDRKQCVCLGDAKSDTLPVLSGVPQGSVLGPLLFLAYISDIPDHVSALLYMYADDVKCARPISSHDNGEILQADLNSLCSCKQWKMTFKYPNVRCYIVLQARHHL